MLDLSEKAMAAWSEKLPPDFREAMADEEAPSGDVSELCDALSGAEAVRVPELVRQHPDAVRRMGRARRACIMAWVAVEARGDMSLAWSRMFDGADEDSSDSGTSGGVGAGDPVGIIFLEDLKAMNRIAIAPRLASGIVAGPSLDIMMEAAITAEQDAVSLVQGGGR